MSDEEVFYLSQLWGEAAPSEGLGGDRPYPKPLRVIELGKADALTGPLVGRDDPARLTADGAEPEVPYCAEYDGCDERHCAYPGEELCRQRGYVPEPKP